MRPLVAKSPRLKRAMGSWAVETKVTKAVKQTSNATFLRPRLRESSSLHHICPSRVSRFLLPFHYLSHNFHQKHRNALLPINLSPLLSPPTAHLPLYLHTYSHFSTVFQPFDEMLKRHQNLEDTRFHYALHLLKSSTLRPDNLVAIVVHCLILKIGALAYLPISTSLLIAYSRTGDLGSSCTLFDEILHRDVILWNAMITASVENRYFRCALDFFVAMMEEGSGFDSTTLLIVVSVLSQMNDLIRGQVLHGLSLKAGMLSDTFLCNALTDMYMKCCDLSSSVCMFEEMEL
ncbi:hypothetical protein L1049_011546 [Liquidambar formosana]|uniref:Pentatricopeptide repeat-containing protein n=1 Tax=Liquidambar formosana TaxID=63359 RepID=A0AAP0RRL3_LIQFO